MAPPKGQPGTATPKDPGCLVSESRRQPRSSEPSRLQALRLELKSARDLPLMGQVRELRELVLELAFPLLDAPCLAVGSSVNLSRPES